MSFYIAKTLVFLAVDLSPFSCRFVLLLTSDTSKHMALKGAY